MKRTLLILFFILAGVIFYRNCVVNGGGDFQVYWNVASRVLGGGLTYSPTTDIPMGFKYPPWLLPLFFPFACLSFESARIAWALLSLAAMYAAFAWIHKKTNVSFAALAASLLFNWGIWGGQFNHGQINVVVLAALLWLWSPNLPMQSRWRSVALIFASTAKIVSAFPLLYFVKRAKDWTASIALSLFVFFAMSVPSLLNTAPPKLKNLLADWRTVAGSAMKGFGPEFARGRMNQGLPVVFGRITDFNSTSDLPELIGMLIIGAALGVWWHRASKTLSPHESWAGWVAWICLIGPLSWSHNFVMALPLLALSVDRAWKSGRSTMKGFAILGLTCTGILTFNTAKAATLWLGAPEALVTSFVFLEHASIKSIGVLICAVVFLKSRQAPSAQGH